MVDIPKILTYTMAGIGVIGGLRKIDDTYEWGHGKWTKFMDWWHAEPVVAPPEEQEGYIPIEGEVVTPEFALPVDTEEPAITPVTQQFTLAPSAQYSAQQLADLMPTNLDRRQFPTDIRGRGPTGKEERDPLAPAYTVPPGSSVQVIRVGILVRTPQVPNQVGRIVDLRKGEALVRFYDAGHQEWIPVGDLYQVEGQYN